MESSGKAAESSALNTEVRAFWEEEPCGTGEEIVGALPTQTREWYERIEEHRYKVEPFIHSVAQFTRHHGKKVLEIGVGAGTDHLQWARAGVDLHGVDLTDAAIETTRARLAMYGFSSTLRRVDAEILPFDDATFDVVYSWGVIHHSAHPEKILHEARRVLKPGGTLIAMFYGRRSPLAVKLWVRHALLKGRPWRSLANVVWHHMESIGTKSYTVSELKSLLSMFSHVDVEPIITTYDTAMIPRFVSRYFPQAWGWFIAIKATR